MVNHIAVCKDGCWQYKDFHSSRATFIRGGMQWLVYRFLYVWFYGGHHGRYELHHKCLNSWCVRPDHLKPITPALNQALETEAKYQFDRGMEAAYVERDAEPPADPIKAEQLARFTDSVIRAGVVAPAVIDPVVIPAPAAPEPAPKPVKVDLFLDTRPPQDARSRRRRRTVARS